MKYKFLGTFVFSLAIGYFIGTTTERTTKNSFPCLDSGISNKNSLKGLSNFLFFSMVPKSNSITEKELEKYGNVRETELLSIKEEGIEFNQVESDATFIFSIKEADTSFDKSSNFVIASLTLDSFALVKKNNQEVPVTLWSNSYIISKNQDTDELPQEKAINILMNMFMKDYSSVNTKQPTFQLVFQK